MNKRIIIAILALFSLTFAMAKPKAVRLVTENMENPLGLPTHTPRFSWQLTEAKKNTMQTAYRIMVASAPELLKEGILGVFGNRRLLLPETLHLVYVPERKIHLCI